MHEGRRGNAIAIRQAYRQLRPIEAPTQHGREVTHVLHQPRERQGAVEPDGRRVHGPQEVQATYGAQLLDPGNEIGLLVRSWNRRPGRGHLRAGDVQGQDQGGGPGQQTHILGRLGGGLARLHPASNTMKHGTSASRFITRTSPLRGDAHTCVAAGGQCSSTACGRSKLFVTEERLSPGTDQRCSATTGRRQRRVSSDSNMTSRIAGGQAVPQLDPPFGGFLAGGGDGARSTSRRTQQPSRWSSTSPTACMTE